MNICQAMKFEEVDSFSQRLEKMLSWKDRKSKYVKRNVLKRHDDNVLIVRNRFDFDKNIMLRLPDLMTDNLVTNDGDQYYAESASNGNSSITIPFQNSSGRQELGNGSQGTPNKSNTYSALIGPISASRKTYTAGYPKTNDGDTDNTGAGVRVLTWATLWATTDFNDNNITGGVIHDAAGSPVSGSKLLTYWTITAFAKTATDTLKIFVNHTLNGV